MTVFFSARRLTVARICLLAGLISTPIAYAQALDDSGWFGAKASPNAESPVVFPAAPSELLHVHITAGGALQFFVDAASISVQPGQTVRYTLVAKTAGGPSNISYEGIDCARKQWTIYAIWNDASKQWIAASTRDWRPIHDYSATRIHSTLYSDDFCKDNAVNGTAADIAQRIKQGLRALP